MLERNFTTLAGSLNIPHTQIHIPKLITAIAWNTSSFIKVNMASDDPLISVDVLGPSTATLTMMTMIAIRANALVFASFDISR